MRNGTILALVLVGGIGTVITIRRSEPPVTTVTRAPAPQPPVPGPTEPTIEPPPSDGADEYDRQIRETRERAEAAVLSELRDPDSAQFRNVMVLAAPGEPPTYVCGEFNATNGFGGRVGYRHFLWGIETEGGRRELLTETDNLLANRILEGLWPPSCGEW